MTCRSVFIDEISLMDLCLIVCQFKISNCEILFQFHNISDVLKQTPLFFPLRTQLYHAIIEIYIKQFIL